jgi:hypothetical protein
LCHDAKGPSLTVLASKGKQRRPWNSGTLLAGSEPDDEDVC